MYSSICRQRILPINEHVTNAEMGHFASSRLFVLPPSMAVVISSTGSVIANAVDIFFLKPN